MDLAEPLVASFEPEDGIARAVSRDRWRPIHYLGSKLRALPALEKAILSVIPRGAPVCDLFAGSGTVSAWLAHSHPVTAVDIQEYSRVISDALLTPAPLSVAAVEADLSCRLEDAGICGVIFAARPLIHLEARAMSEARDGRPAALAALLESGSITNLLSAKIDDEHSNALAECHSRIAGLSSPPIASMVLRHFGGVYFSYQQAAELDVILDYAHNAPSSHKSTLIAATLSTASEIVNTVGKHFAQPLRPRNKDGTIKRSLHSQASRDRHKATLEVFADCLSKYVSRSRTAFAHRAIRSDYLDFLDSKDFDAHVVYADPPYTRDHYSRFYHVLETLALRDDPGISTNTAHGRTVPSRGVYRQERHQSPFCIRSEAPKAFDELFGRVARKRVPLIVSYSPYASEKNAHPRVMTMDAVADLAKCHFRKVDVASVGTFSHSRLNRSDLNKDISYEAEYLLTCEP